MKKAIVVTIILACLVSACSNSPFVQATETPIPTNTPTNTPEPTATPTPLPTATPTLVPTPTGSGMGKIAYIKKVGSDNNQTKISNIYMYDFSTQTENQITFNKKDTNDYVHHNVNWSPDGKTLVFTASEYTYDYGDSQYWNSLMYTMNSDGTDIKKLSVHPQYVGDYEGEYVLSDARPVFFDNENILFLSNRKNLQNFLWEPLTPYLINRSTLEISVPFTTYLQVNIMTVAPDQSKIVFMAGDGARSELYLVDLSDNAKVKQLTSNNFSDRFPTFSPDGKRIVFHSDMDGNIELYVMELETDEITRVTFNSAIDATSSWSPDGNWLAFFSDQTGVLETFIQNIYTSERIQLTNGGDEVSYVRWSP